MTMRPWACWPLLALWLLFPGASPAHQNTRAYGDLELSAERARLTLFVRFADWDEPLRLDLDRDGTITRDELQPSAGAIERQLAAAISGRSGSEPCPFRVASPVLAVRHAQPYVMSTLDFDCPGPIRRFTLRYDLFARTHPGHSMLASLRIGDTAGSHVFRTDPRAPAEYSAELSSGSSPWRSGANFLALGFHHIITGYDHLAFLLAVVVTGGTLKKLVQVVTAFTLAHSVTLALAALDLVRLPSGPVEAVIALSIVAVAAENASSNASNASLPRWRLPLTFLFGLVHGFGFAGALSETGLDRSSALVSLLCFNLGVEAGQVLMVACLYPGLRWLERQSFRLQTVRAVSVTILALGLWLLVERTLG